MDLKRPYGGRFTKVTRNTWVDTGIVERMLYLGTEHLSNKYHLDNKYNLSTTNKPSGKLLGSIDSPWALQGLYSKGQIELYLMESRAVYV